MSRIAITGGRGRIAPFVAADLRAAGHDVVSFSRTAGDGHEDIESLLHPEKMAAFESVLHLGWSTVPFTSEEQPGQEQSKDLPLLGSLLAACHETQFVFFSTGAVYGDTEAPAAEDSHCHPLGRYASAKLMAEQMVRAASPRHCVLRVSNVFGFPGHSTKPQGLIPRLCEAIHDGTSISIWGDGTGTKDYLCHTDFLTAIRATLDHRLAGVFNIASGESFSVNDIIALLERTAGKKLSLERLPHFAWDVTHTKISRAKFSQATGWQPRRDIESEIREMLANAQTCLTR